jgi:hypothetical protein
VPGVIAGSVIRVELLPGPRALRPFLDVMPVLADPGYEGAGHGVHVPVKKPARVKELDIDTRARNALLRSVRCPGSAASRC